MLEKASRRKMKGREDLRRECTLAGIIREDLQRGQVLSARPEVMGTFHVTRLKRELQEQSQGGRKSWAGLGKISLRTESWGARVQQCRRGPDRSKAPGWGRGSRLKRRDAHSFLLLKNVKHFSLRSVANSSSPFRIQNDRTRKTA